MYAVLIGFWADFYKIVPDWNQALDEVIIQKVKK